MSLSTGCVLEVDGNAIESLVSKDRYHHTLVATDTVTTRGNAGKGTLFNGTTSFVDCGNDASLNLIYAITIEAWINPTGWGGDGFGMILCNGKLVFLINHFASADMLTFYSDGVTDISSNLNSITLNKWQYVCVERNSTGWSNIYINSVLKGSGDSGTPTTGTTNLFIGNNLAGDRTFDGIINNVKIYNYALSATQIKRNYLSKAYLYQPHPVKIP